MRTAASAARTPHAILTMNVCRSQGALGWLCRRVALERIAGAESGIALGGRPVAAAARHEELDQVAGPEDLLRFRIRGRPAVDQERARGAGLPAEETLGRDHRAVAEDGTGRRVVGQHPEAQHLAEAAPEAAVAARAVAERLALDEERREGLHDLDRRAQYARREGGGGEPVLGRARARATRSEEGVDEGLLPPVLPRELDAPDIGRALGHDAVGQGLLERAGDGME